MRRYQLTLKNRKTGKTYKVETTYQLKKRILKGNPDKKFPDLSRVTDKKRFKNPLKEGEDVFTFTSGKKSMKLWREGVELP
jgi:hypothetical protein